MCNENNFIFMMKKEKQILENPNQFDHIFKNMNIKLNNPENVEPKELFIGIPQILKIKKTKIIQNDEEFNETNNVKSKMNQFIQNEAIEKQFASTLIIQLYVSLFNEKSFSLSVTSNSLMKNIKFQIEQRLHIPVSHQFLHFHGILLEDNKPFHYYSFSNAAKINLHIKLSGGSDSLISSQSLFEILHIQDDGSHCLKFNNKEHQFLIKFQNIIIVHENSNFEQYNRQLNSVIVILPISITQLSNLCF
jgi:hypothetical protein